MQPSYGDRYLESEVLTASPQRLHLLLIEAAIRHVERTRTAWQRQESDVAFNCLTKAQQIVAEMLASLKMDAAPDLIKQVAAIYTFVYRRLVEAGLKSDEKLLSDALRVLQIERETWAELCGKLGSTSGADASVPPQGRSNSSSDPVGTPAPPRYLTRGFPDDYPMKDAVGNSWEA